MFAGKNEAFLTNLINFKFSGGGCQNGVKQKELLTHTHKSSDITARASLGRVKYFLFLTD